MLKKHFSYLLFSSLILAYSGAFSQIDNEALFTRTKSSEKDSDKVIFSFTNLNFLRNYEYFQHIATGYTFFGTQLNPKIVYVPNQYLRIEAGIFLRKDFGNPVLKTVAPTFTVKLRKNGYTFLFGNLEGNLNHQLIEPLFNYERIITNPLENGLQFIVDKRKLWLDTWIDWEQQEYQNSPFQEHIFAGLSSKTTIFQPNDAFKIQIPLQATIFHHGGQIDSDSSALLSIGNLAGGFIMDWDLSDKMGFISGIKSENYWLGYKDMSANKLQPFKNGQGNYFNILFKSKYNVNLMVSYWDGNRFIAPHGGFLFQSISSIFGKGNYTEQSRRLLLLRVLYKKELCPDVFLDVRFEPYKDLKNNYTEFSYSVFISYKKDFSLVRNKPIGLK